MDLQWEGKTTRLMLSLAVEPAYIDEGVHTSRSCCKCSKGPCSNSKITCEIKAACALIIRNLSDENIDLAKITLKRQVWNQTGPNVDIAKAEENTGINLTVKRYGQKLVQNYRDVVQFYESHSQSLRVRLRDEQFLLPYEELVGGDLYSGDFVIFEFNLDMEVYKLIGK